MGDQGSAAAAAEALSMLRHEVTRPAASGDGGGGGGGAFNACDPWSGWQYSMDPSFLHTTHMGAPMGPPTHIPLHLALHPAQQQAGWYGTQAGGVVWPYAVLAGDPVYLAHQGHHLPSAR